MKNVILVIAMILFSSCVTSEFTAEELESSTNQKLFLSRHVNPHWPFHGSGKKFPPISTSHFQPTPFHLPHEITRCLSDKIEVQTCFDDITQFFYTGEADLGSECCDAIKKMNADCEKTVFGSFRSPILTGYVKLYCSTVVGSTAPAPSLVSSQAPSQAPSQVPLHAPSHPLSHAPLHAPSLAPSLSPLPAPSPVPSQTPSSAKRF